MPQNFLNVLRAISRIGARPDDSDAVRLQKAVLAIFGTPNMLVGYLWGLLYFAFGEPVTGSIPLVYGVVSTLTLTHLALTGRHRLHRKTQLLMVLLLPFLVQLSLGGLVSSSAVLLWSMLTPFQALLTIGPRRSLGWFLAYLGLVVASSFLQPYLRASNNLSLVIELIFFVLNIGGVSAIAFGLLYFFVSQRDEAFSLLHIEQKKSENLLLNILPAEIVELLKKQPGTIADYFDEVSVLFADVVNFTPMVAQMTPIDVVNLLNEVFSYFDLLVEKYNLEKIKTIGDAYMVAAGVPKPRNDHAQAIANVALEMCAYICTHPSVAGRRVDFRIGINSGPVVAGVIGRQKFQYDMWGDVVNTASRMESHGEGGRIQITRATYLLLKEEFVCEPRGSVTVKGKGEIETWYLMGKRAYARERK
jgi:guanylate cyclase